MSDIGLTHVALPVRALDASVAFYAQYANMHPVHRRRGVVWITDRTRPFAIVLIETSNEIKPLLPMAHLGVGVESKEAVDRLCELARQSQCLVREPENSGPPVGYWALIRDPDGHTLEVAYGQELGLAVHSEESSMVLSNYLFFTTSCEQALAFYTQCGLGTVVTMVRHGENGMPVSNESMRGKVMHSQFEGSGVRFYASDNDDAEPMRGSAMIFMLTDAEHTRVLFARLADGGRITTPLAVQPWGDYFGKLTDRFGVQWMFNCASRP